MLKEKMVQNTLNFGSTKCHSQKRSRCFKPGVMEMIHDTFDVSFPVL